MYTAVYTAVLRVFLNAPRRPEFAHVIFFSSRPILIAWAVSSNMTEGIAEIKQFQSPRKTMKFTLKPCLKPGILSTTAYFLNLIFSANLRSSKPDYDAMCSLANSMIYRAVQNYKIRINYLTFSGTTVSTSIRFPRSSLPRLLV